jgi:hypothetical protein
MYQYGTNIMLISSYFKKGPWEEYKLDRYKVLNGWALYYSRSKKTPYHWIIRKGASLNATDRRDSRVNSEQIHSLNPVKLLKFYLCLQPAT